MQVPDLTRVPGRLWHHIEAAAGTQTLCPPLPRVFRAFELTPPERTRVVIIGQDPYHRPGKASGLAFGYHPDYDGLIDSSLMNICKEVERDTHLTVQDFTLESWARQGVLLINTRLTTTHHTPLAHSRMGWEPLILNYVRELSETQSGVVFMLWGREARAFAEHIVSSNNLILQTSHPCAYSAGRGFHGCAHFSQCNDYLVARGGEPIIWGEAA